MNIRLIDVSFRDGGHRNDFNFSKKSTGIILSSLDSAGVDYIELGYRNGNLSSSEQLGPAGLCQRPFLDECRLLAKHARLAVMAHPGRLSDACLDDLADAGVDLLRLCLSRGNVAQVLPWVEKIRERGMKISVNAIHISQYSADELKALMDILVPASPDIIYFADSNGAMFPERVAALYDSYSSNQPVPLGFHAHDHLGLAMANTLAAIQHGAAFIDASLAGIGKGTGNLKIEFFSACYQAMYGEKYLLNPLIDAANYVEQELGLNDQPLDKGEFIRGLLDLSTAQLKQYYAKLNHEKK